MTPADFCQEIKTPNRKPLYLITGGEPAAVQRCLAAASDAVAPSFRDFNYQLLTLEAGQAKDLVEAVYSSAFGQPPRIIVAKNPNFKEEKEEKEKKEKKKKNDDWEVLLKYMGNPSPDNTIILVLDKIDGRLGFFKKVKAAKLEVDCQVPKGNALTTWLMAEFKARQIKATPSLCNLIIEQAGSNEPGGSNLEGLANEAEKLSLYLGAGGQLTEELVRSMVSIAPGGNVFALGDALSARQLSEALIIVRKLLENEHHLPILAMMVRQFRLLLAIKTRQRSSGSNHLDQSEAASLGIHPFVLKKTQNATGDWSWQQLRNALAALEDAHRALVTTSTPPSFILEDLVFKIISYR